MIVHISSVVVLLTEELDAKVLIIVEEDRFNRGENPQIQAIHYSYCLTALEPWTQAIHYSYCLTALEPWTQAIHYSYCLTALEP